MKVLDFGEVILRKSMADDLDVVEAARVSNAELDDVSKGVVKDEGLIRYLIKHRHGTPFEHTYFKFRVTVPIFVAREWHRHRIGWSYNEVSGRYVRFGIDYPIRFYVPELARVPGSTTKQGSVFVEPGDSKTEEMQKIILEANKNSLDAYQTLIDAGVARELARMVLPLNLYTSYYATCNARSLMAFISLRNAPDAQWEIREYARIMEDMFATKMPFTHSAFVENGRIGP